MSEAVATSQQGLVEKYQPYPEYDDSGIEWLGRIPVHWKLATLKHECVFSGGGTPTKDNLAYWGGDIPWISPKDMKSQVVTDSIDKITAVAVAESSTKLVPEGALLMVVRSGILQRTIPVAINTVPVTLNQDMKALRFKSKDKACFFLYYIQGLESQLLLEWCKQGATVESIEHELLANARYPLPPNDELKAINQFLDYETARIDRLITQQLRLIELLKEKRQAVISHAVTKGLNPDAPMKDSGIEWLGQVPEHWSESPLKNILSLKHGFAFDGNKFSDSGEYILMTPGNFNEHGGFREKAPEKYFVGDDFSTDFILSAGQLLVAMTEQAPGLLGSALFVPSEKSYLHNQRLGLVTDVRESEVSIQYLYHIFNSIRYRAEVSVSATGAKVRHSSTEKMLSIKVYLPPLTEQGQIVRYLNDKIDAIETLNKKVQTAIELLKERRTALISSAVTGKIDLRGWTPPAEETAA
ncbi:restriction endonuclease subunit S [Aeromonas veronii]|uniref:restriction endonuclease subunit S n=1 Tax=Aeromonas veronii TaxID=654 RepID=UPI000D7584D0